MPLRMHPREDKHVGGLLTFLNALNGVSSIQERKKALRMSMTLLVHANDEAARSGTFENYLDRS